MNKDDDLKKVNFADIARTENLKRRKYITTVAFEIHLQLTITHKHMKMRKKKSKCRHKYYYNIYLLQNKKKVNHLQNTVYLG